MCVSVCVYGCMGVLCVYYGCLSVFMCRCSSNTHTWCHTRAIISAPPQDVIYTNPTSLGPPGAIHHLLVVVTYARPVCVFMCVCMYVWMYICYVYIYVCMYVCIKCMYIYVYMSHLNAKSVSCT
jgi:hypothetical protein